jgi:hypothetical protein
MKDYIVEFPLRTICLKREDKVQTSLEAEGLYAYCSMHTRLWNLKLQWQKLQLQLAKLKPLAAAFDAKAAEMETETKRYGIYAGYSEEETKLFFPEMDFQYTLKITHLQSLITGYGALVDTYAPLNKALNKALKKVDEQYEEFADYHTYFIEQCFTPMLKEYDVLQIDTASLDKDFDEFREKWTEVDALRDEIIDEWNEISEALKVICNKVTALDVRFKHISQMFNSTNPAKMNNDNAALN